MSDWSYLDLRKVSPAAVEFMRENATNHVRLSQAIRNDPRVRDDAEFREDCLAYLAQNAREVNAEAADRFLSRYITILRRQLVDNRPWK